MKPPPAVPSRRSKACSALTPSEPSDVSRKTWSHCWPHYRFDKRFWQALKTTNPIERINKEFKRRTKSMETIGEATLEAVVAFVCLRLEVGWQHHTIDARALNNLNLSPTRTVRPNTIQQAIQKLTEPID